MACVAGFQPRLLRLACPCAFAASDPYHIAVLVLHVLQGPDRGKKFELPAHEPQLIGRSSEALPITDNTVSRRHAELTPDDGKWWLRDLESANGTWVNGYRITSRVQLAAGDQIRCGSTLMLFALAPDDTHTDSELVRVLPSEIFDTTIESRVGSGITTIAGASDPARAAADHLRVIYHLTALTASTIDRQELLERVMDLIFAEFRADRGFILLRDHAVPARSASEGNTPENDGATDSLALRPSEKDTPRLTPLVVRYRVRPKTVDEGRIPVSRTIVQHTLEKNEGILSTNAMNDDRFRAGDSVRDYGIRSAICVPLRTGEQTFGVIHIDSSLANVTFTPEQLRLMNAIGLHTGLALKSAEALASKMQTERLAAMGETVASLSHSIKNILQGLRGGADAVELALNKEDLKLAKEGWPILARNLDRIFALTLNMLAYSKPRSLEIESLALNALVKEAAELIQPQCDRRRIGLILDLADDIPPIPADAGALHQAVMNLLTNAVEAVPDKKGVITVTTRYVPPTTGSASGGAAQIIVSDNGPGIDPEWRDQIFEAFTSTKGQRGTGLGLAVTRKIITQHGGRVELDSSTAKGTTFVITLPGDRAGQDPGATRLPKPLTGSQLRLVDEFEE